MSTAYPHRTGGRLLADTLRSLGTEYIFCVPGESFIAILDACHDQRAPQVVTCRHEGGASFMAEAFGKLTGRPGVAVVTRGPGACNAAIGVHTAYQDSTPLLLVVGQVGRDHADREAFQEVDFRRMFAPLAKAVIQVERTARIPELTAHAMAVAVGGRPGPVVLVLPEDILSETAAVAEVGARTSVVPGVAAEDLDRALALLARAERPLVLVGGGWSDAAAAALRSFAEVNRLPVAVAFRRLDSFANDSPSFVGELGIGANPRLVDRVQASDLVLALGTRLGEMTTQGYTLFEHPQPRQRLIQVYPAAEELGRLYQPTLAIQATGGRFAQALAGKVVAAAPVWRDWTVAARADYLDWTRPQPRGGACDPAMIFDWLADRLPADSVVTTDAGNFAGWASRYLRYRRPGRQLGPTNGAMGYGVPAAVAAKLVHPERLAIAMVGDGGFLMTGQELATARHYQVAPIVLVFDNGMYGTIRMHQERRYPGRVIGTTLTNPDFAALARSYGAFGAAIDRTADFAPAFEAAVAAGGPAVLAVRIDPDLISTTARLSALGRPTG